MMIATIFVPKIQDREQQAKDCGLLLFNPREIYPIEASLACQMDLVPCEGIKDGYHWSWKVYKNKSDQPGLYWLNWLGHWVLSVDLQTLEIIVDYNYAWLELPICTVATVADLQHMAKRLSRELVMDLQRRTARWTIEEQYTQADGLEPIVVAALRPLIAIDYP